MHRRHPPPLGSQSSPCSCRVSLPLLLTNVTEEPAPKSACATLSHCPWAMSEAYFTNDSTHMSLSSALSSVEPGSCSHRGDSLGTPGELRLACPKFPLTSPGAGWISSCRSFCLLEVRPVWAAWHLEFLLFLWIFECLGPHE